MKKASIFFLIFCCQHIVYFDIFSVEGIIILLFRSMYLYYSVYNWILKSIAVFSEKFHVVSETWMLKAVSLNRWPSGGLLMAGMAAAQGNILYMPDLYKNSEYGRDEPCARRNLGSYSL